MVKLLFASLVFALCACNSSKKTQAVSDTLLAAELHPFGRTSFNPTTGLELISSASSFSFTLEDDQCEIYARLTEWQDHNYLQYEVDGNYIGRIRIYKNSSVPYRLKFATEGKHRVTVFKATEAHTGPVFIEKLAGKGIRSTEQGGEKIIEFIGNSITCGAAADASETDCGKGAYHDQHNAYYAYGPRVARNLGVNFVLSSVSGIGIYRNWNSEGPSMPQVYEKLDFRVEGERYWDFKKYSPAVVSIALGTNDLSNGDGKKPRLPFDSARYVSGYINFVQLVKTKYPAAKIVLLSSPMANGQRRILLQNCLSAVKQKVDEKNPRSKPISVHFFKPMQARGCTGHPSVEDHAILADELVPFFKELMIEKN